MSLDMERCPAGNGGASGRRYSSGSGGGVSLVRVVRQQDMGAILSTIIVCIGLTIAQAALGGPRDRPFVVTDATISYPHTM